MARHAWPTSLSFNYNHFSAKISIQNLCADPFSLRCVLLVSSHHLLFVQNKIAFLLEEIWSKCLVTTRHTIFKPQPRKRTGAACLCHHAASTLISTPFPLFCTRFRANPHWTWGDVTRHANTNGTYSVVNGSVHTGCKQHQRNCPKICVLASSMDCGLCLCLHPLQE